LDRRQFVTVAVGGALAVPSLSPAAGTGGLSSSERSRDIERVVGDVLENFLRNGFNADPGVNQGLGGLWINWRTGSSPLQTNFSTAGVPDTRNKDGSKRHDELTDLRYLHNLWTCRTVFPDIAVADAEIQRFTRIVKAELTPAKNDRGWVYDLVFDLHRLSGDPFYRDAARSLAQHFADDLYKLGVGSVCKFKKTDGRTTSAYRVDHALEIGSALVQAGTVFGDSCWTRKGRGILDFVYRNAYLPEFRTFPSELDEILLLDGTVNLNPRFYRDGDSEGGSAKPPALGQMALALLHAHIITSERSFLDLAREILFPLTSRVNSLGLWDAEHGGYWDKTIFGGTHVRQPGTARVRRVDKEGGRQLHLLQAFAVANRLGGGQFQEMEDALLEIALDRAYSCSGRGYVHLSAPDWSLLEVKQGGRRDWVTTEAMGVALEALLSLRRKDPW
jgi:hypothetical protein